MSNDASSDGKSVDLFGVRPLARVAEIAAEGSMKGAGAFLSRICLPAAEEFGFLLQDHVKNWRAKNIRTMEDKASKKYAEINGTGPVKAHAHPRIVSKIIEGSSWEDNSDVQDLWAGLLASACGADGLDQSNLLYVSLMSRITPTQASLINMFCKKAPKYVVPPGVSYSERFTLTLDEICAISPSTALEQIDAEIDALRELGLILGGINTGTTEATITVTGLALNFYVRCHGSLVGPVKFFDLQPPPPDTKVMQVFSFPTTPFNPTI